MLTLAAYGRSELGLHREGNEDAALFCPTLCAVADGLGGHAAGEIASRFAIKEIFKSLSLTQSITAPILEKKIYGIDEGIAKLVATSPQYEGMGTTLTLVALHDRELLLAHVGDSRAYLLRKGNLAQLTRDHTMIQELLDRGEITSTEATQHPSRSLLTQALMGQGSITPEIATFKVKVGDRLLLCSDGLSNVVETQSIRDALAQPTVESAVDTLVSLTYAAGAPDNVTVIVIEVRENETAAQRITLLGAALEGERP